MTIEPVQIEKADFRGWRAVYLRNGLVTLAAVPDIGGRLMAYDLGSYPYLFVDAGLAGKLFTLEENQGDGSLAAWKNYGGDKTWPSPQGWQGDDQWHGPPDPILDTGRYSVTRLESGPGFATIQMASPPDPRTGIQITRQATLNAGSSRVALDLTFTNVSDRPVRWSIWDVVQLRAERELPDGRLAPELACLVTVPLNPRSRFPKGYNVMFGDEDNPQWDVDLERGLFVGRYRWEIGKVAIDSQSGWISFCNEAAGYAFVERFKVFPGEGYPDRGATVECWTVGRGRVANLDYETSNIYLMETEVLSPLYDFQTGESRSFSIEWGASRCPGVVIDVGEAGCTARFEIEIAGDIVRLSGAFGVFDQGILSLAWKRRDGRLLETAALGRVGPLEVVILEREIEQPAGAAAVELQVTADFDGITRPLVGRSLED
jgi:hypothetical protein